MSSYDRVRAGDRDLSVLAAGARVALVGKVAGRGVHVLGQVVAARLLGAAGFGLYAIGWTLLRIVTKIGPLGVDHGVIRFGSAHWLESRPALRSLIQLCLAVALMSGLSLGAAFFLGAETVASKVFGKPELTHVLRIFALAFPFAILLRVAAAATRTSQSVRYAIVAEDLGQPLVFLAVAVPWLLTSRELAGVLWPTVISFMVGLGVAVAYLNALFDEVGSEGCDDRAAIGRLLSFSIPASLSGTFVMLLVWADRLMIGALRPAADVGVYQAVSQSAIVFAVILGAFSAIFPPQIATLHRQGESERMEELYRVSTKWGLYLSVPLFLVVFFEPGELIGLIFGSEYVVGSTALVVLTLGQLGNVATGGASQLLTMTGHQNRWLVTSGLGLTLNIVLNLLLIPRFGIEGAAAASAISVIGLFVAAVVQTGVVLGMWPYDVRYLKGLAAAAAAVGALLALKAIPWGLPLLEVTLVAILGASVFFSVLVSLGLDREDEEIEKLFRSLWSRADR